MSRRALAGKGSAALLALLAALWVAVALPPIAAADTSMPTMDRPLADPVLEAQARALMREIRCVVCQSQSIDESDADIAAELRNIIREQIAAGRSTQQIRDYLTARYGDFVLLDPPFKPETVILWLGPFVLAALALAAGFGVLRRSRRPAGADPTAEFAPPDLTRAERNRLQELLVEGDIGTAGNESGSGTA